MDEDMALHFVKVLDSVVNSDITITIANTCLEPEKDHDSENHAAITELEIWPMNGSMAPSELIELLKTFIAEFEAEHPDE